MLPTPTGLTLWPRGGSMSQSSPFRSSGKWGPIWNAQGVTDHPLGSVLVPVGAR